MRRRRFLALTAFTVGFAGCVGSDYRAGGPRTPPPAPATEAAASSVDSVEARAQDVIRPLNEAYRLFRTPLVTLDVASVARADVSAAENAVTTAREAAATFSTDVTDPPATYRSLLALATAHELLVDALTVAVDLSAALSQLATEQVDGPASRLEPLRSQAMRLGSLGDELRDLAATEPTVPGALFLTLDRMRSFATTLVRQSTAVGRLLDAVEPALNGATHWRRGVTLFERRAFADAESAFTAARTRYRAASDELADPIETAGSFATVTARWSCVTEASLDATATALDAVQTGRNGDVARASDTLRTAQTTRNRCANG